MNALMSMIQDPAFIASASEAGWMFLRLFAELSLLFLVISYGVSLLQQVLPAAKIRNLLSARKGQGYLMAAGLGAITPFCSCSTIPMLVGLLRAQAGFGPVMTFLFTSPLLNPIIIALFVPVLGWQATLMYAGLALGASVIAGITLERFGFMRYVRAEMLTAPASGCGAATGCGTNSPTPKSLGAAAVEARPITENRWQKAWADTWPLFKSMLPWMMIAMAVGALVHGFVPAAFFAEVAGPDNPLAVPTAAVVGIPLYVRVSTLLPLVGAFLAKGVSIGAIIALVIGSGGASLPELILLKKLFHWPLLIAFLAVIFLMAVLGGYGFNLVLA